MARQRNSECVMTVTATAPARAWLSLTFTLCCLTVSFVPLLVSCGSVTNVIMTVQSEIPNFPCSFEGTRGSYDFSPYNTTQVKYSYPDGWMFFFQICSAAPGTKEYPCDKLNAMMCAVKEDDPTNRMAFAYPNDSTGQHEWLEMGPPYDPLGVRLNAMGGPCFGGNATFTLDIHCDPSVSEWPTEFDSMWVGNCGSLPVMTHKSACGSKYNSATASM